MQSILNEKEILCSLYCPFIVNMKCSFQDREDLYLVLDYLTGGDLRYHLCSKPTFTEEESSNTFRLFRVHGGMHSAEPGVHPLKQYSAQRYQTLKLSV